VNLAALTMTFLALVAVPQGEQGKPVAVRIVAVQAYNSGQKTKQFGRGLEEIRAALKDIKFDTYRLVKAATVNVPYNKEARVPINAKYSLYIIPLSKESRGRIKLKVRVAMAPEGRQKKPVNAVMTTVVAVPGKQFKLRGLPLDRGELIVVLSVAVHNGPVA